MKLRAAVVGVGYLGRFHAQKYASLKEEVELVGVCDARAEQSQKVAQELAVKSFSQVDDLIGKVDVATVATQTSVHYEVAKKLLNAGIHLLVEKPLTVTSKEGEDLRQIAIQKKLVLQPGHIERYNPSFLELKKLVQNVQGVEAFRLAPFKPRALDVDVCTDLMIHDIDLMLNLIPEEITRIDASGYSVMTKTIDVAQAVFHFKSGKKGFIAVNRCYPHAVRTISAYDHRTHVFADLGQSKVTMLKRDIKDIYSEEMPQTKVLEVEKKDALLEETKAFVNAVRGEPVAVTAEQGVRAIKVLEQVLELIKR